MDEKVINEFLKYIDGGMKMKQFISDETYSELFEVLKAKQDFTNKIPEEVLRHVYNKVAKSKKKFEYDSEKDILKCISKETFALYVALYLQYIASEQEKMDIKNVLIKNEMKQKNIKPM